GVHVNGIDLSGQNIEQASTTFSESFSFTQKGVIAFNYEDKSWSTSPGKLGLSLDTFATFQKAYLVGRAGWPWERWSSQFNIWQYGIDISPLLVFDGRTAQLTLNQLASQINTETKEANITIENGIVNLTSGQIGNTVNAKITMAGLFEQISSMQDGNILVIVDEHPPVILDASEQAAIIKNILSEPLVISINNPQGEDVGPWKFDRQTLAGLLTIERVPSDNGSENYQIGIDSIKLEGFLQRIAPSLILFPKNARFVFNDETSQLEVLQPSVIGRELNIPNSITNINNQINIGNHNINLVFDNTNPEASDQMSGEELGVNELISSQTTYFYGSSAGRIQNIQTSAAQFHGLMVPPGATFSMVENIGDISLDTGYAEALIIYGDRTIKGVGGGVCQVSTTLFRTVFFGGFPVEERYSHAYRVYYYELNQSGGVNAQMAGLDATVYSPIIDFKFTNDSESWLLMETYVNSTAKTITWKFYSTSDGRTVEWTNSGLINKKNPPKAIYEENDELPKGTVKQV
ncbi:MAG: VanW family protein, partial [Chloroflexota bacterium]